jgi:hypothetical protein
MRIAPLALALCIFSTSCAGKTISTDLGDAGSAIDSSTDDVYEASGPSCADLAAQLASMKTTMKTCCPICNTPQCMNVVDDVCCPFSISGTPPPEWSATLATYHAQCPIACPGLPCAPAPSKNCVSSDPTHPGVPGVCQ